MKNAVIFASGAGTNAENIINHFENSDKIKFPLILSNKPNAGVIERAKRLGIPSLTFTKEELNNGTIATLLKERKTDLIILAGFLLKIPQNLLDAFPNKIINIHPALLPKFGGKGMYGDHVHEAVVEAKERESGITVHYVDSHYDHGTTILQAKCPVTPSDTPHDVASKVHALEYEFFPKAIETLL